VSQFGGLELPSAPSVSDSDSDKKSDDKD
jgi:hypothetical protein